MFRGDQAGMAEWLGAIRPSGCLGAIRQAGEWLGAIRQSGEWLGAMRQAGKQLGAIRQAGR